MMFLIGCVQHSLDGVDLPNPPKGEWLHADLCRTANDVHGIDILKPEIETLNENGYSAEVANAESFSFERGFDKIVAGELIEHLSNPGDFLDCCMDHLNSDGSVILTTPNPRRLQMLMWFLKGDESRANNEHTMWFDPFVMDTLASRHGFEITDWDWFQSSFLAIPRILYKIEVAEPPIAGGYVFELKPKE